KFRAAHRFAADKGWKFKIISETRLYVGLTHYHL
ncbi:endonuclease, partial [Acinetobacter baumannii]|nr:endonuclease [Acinetobacter baumannii]MCJ8842357.1 endonuclease [Acinetobacter baumannii]MCJ9233637.1 endonuclease [Acinetobacter baumannii]MCJ9336402.1 endonuclease [Acinetobacter baumannii]MCJ9420260.1 endonuclease [Acinetobacter baumannii]